MLVAAFLVGGPAVVSAQMPPPEPFPDSRLEQEITISSPGHLVLFSPVREVNNEIRSAVMARLPVKGLGQLYEVQGGANREEARDHYLRELQTRGAQILFECSGRNCGRSNVWANQIFDQSSLYGRDNNQDYLVAGSVDENGKPWLTLVYTVTRANQRQYVWVEHLVAPQGTEIPGLGNESARIKGPVIVPWKGGITYRFEWSSADRRIINDWAGEEGARVILTAYSELKENESFEESAARAEEAAKSLAQVLAKSGVSESRQTIITVGPAVVIPNPDRQGDRVEVMVITR
ncbi:DUF4892 domain-containing protein [Marinobacter panjinensis]|uniref:DUF4892 domain-containing protein n=1 Tax=Marinobacter panjinensis TaxID=2576384 RepID=A0A4V6CXE8_9GAMM|nr:DUF4892 domain-containing protein [Marinobacter panjinensis]MCR8915886.1 DUF4892 domain-containing protein [Marinobacter panjinensis]TKV67145.1 DUF4892 domain-containing protein [Marinobacter panjinensis]